LIVLFVNKIEQGDDHRAFAARGLKWSATPPSGVVDRADASV